jgi:DNA replication initiation complex subunit (GINS family)
MLNPQSLKVNVNVYLLRAQQIFRTAQAILTRNGVMNQRELTMAEKRMYGDLKLFIQNASKSEKPLVASCTTCS